MELLLELNADADIQDEVRILLPFYTLYTDALIQNRTIFSWLHIRSSYFNSIFIAVSMFLFFQKSFKSLCAILFIYSIGCVQVWMWLCLNLIIHIFLSQDGNTPLILCTLKARPDLVQVLLEKGCNINIQNKVSKFIWGWHIGVFVHPILSFIHPNLTCQKFTKRSKLATLHFRTHFILAFRLDVVKTSRDHIFDVEYGFRAEIRPCCWPCETAVEKLSRCCEREAPIFSHRIMQVANIS